MSIRFSIPKSWVTGRLQILALCGLGAFNQNAQAAFTYPNCADVKEADFQYVPIVGRASTVPTLSSRVASNRPLVVDGTMNDPIHMAFDLVNKKANIYWVERKSGNIKLYDATANTVKLVGTVSGVNSGGERGLTGIALDPDFKTNKYLYVFYAASAGTEFRISRFTLNASGTLNNASESIMMRFPYNGQNHTGGAMAFDAAGDLYVTVGKNATDYPNSYYEPKADSSTEATAGNLNDYRGGLIRIHPTADGKYTVPKGNFGEYFSEYFKSKGNATLAAEYADPTKVKPELYVKGTRNAYSIAVEPVKRLVAWGEFGINNDATWSEEHNLVAHPIFGGYPYFAGGFGTGAGTGYYELWKGTGADRFKAAHGSLTESISGPTNESKWNTGPKQLPPVTPALNTYQHRRWAGAVTGPIYRHDAANSATFGLPPHFDGAWFITDWMQGSGDASEAPNGFKGAKIYKLNATYDQKIDSLLWFKDLGWITPISFDQGPDGAVYLMFYNCGVTKTCEDAGNHIGRIEYKGAPCAVSTAINNTQTRLINGLKADLASVEVLAAEPSSLTIRNSDGREIFSAKQEGPRKYALGDKLKGNKGIYLITLRSSLGIQTVKLTSL